MLRPKDSGAPLSSIWAVFPYFIFSVLAFLIAGGILMHRAPDFNGHYLSSVTLSLVHTFVLIFFTSIIIGVLNQFLPVITGNRLHSNRLAVYSFIFFSSGSLLLIYCFHNMYIGNKIQYAAFLIILGVAGNALNHLLTFRKVKDWTIEHDIIATSLIWLLTTVTLGGIMAFNYTYSIIPVSHIQFLKVHAHAGLIGWILMLIMGASSRLFPMFLICGVIKFHYLRAAYLLINLGLIILLVLLYFEKYDYYIYPAIIVALGIVSYLIHIIRIYKSRIRKKLDMGMSLSLYAMFFLLASVPAILISYFVFADTYLWIYLTYGLIFMYGFAGTIIIGQMFKIIPFLIWLYRYSSVSGIQKVPLISDISSVKLMRLVVLCFFGGFLTLGLSMSGMCSPSIPALFMILTGLVQLVNIAYTYYSDSGIPSKLSAI